MITIHLADHFAWLHTNSGDTHGLPLYVWDDLSVLNLN